MFFSIGGLQVTIEIQPKDKKIEQTYVKISILKFTDNGKKIVKKPRNREKQSLNVHLSECFEKKFEHKQRINFWIVLKANLPIHLAGAFKGNFKGGF